MLKKKTSRNALFSLWSLKAEKVLVRLDQNEEKINIRKSIIK